MRYALKTALWGMISLTIWVQMAIANADRAKIEDFLKVTGFDVALESMKLNAETAPLMLGLDKDDFGIQWTQMTEKVFETDGLHELAIDILSETIDSELMDHAKSFYGSDLGQRLVAAENASHMKDDETGKSEAGNAIVSGLKQLGSERVEELQRMLQASDGSGASLRAIQEVQIRFLMAAAGAGVVELSMDEADLRAFISRQDDVMRDAMESSALTGAAYTYQAFSDAEVSAYADALEHPLMKKVYALMNAVQFEIMANRFEALAAEMSKLRPSTDL